MLDLLTPTTFATLWNGLLMTLQLTLLAAALGLLIGIPAGLGLRSKVWAVRRLVGAYTDVFTHIPLPVFLLLFYYGGREFDSTFLGSSLPASVVLGLSLVAGARLARLVQSRLASSSGDRAVSPFRAVAPELAPWFVTVMLDSAWASVVAVMDLFLSGQRVSSANFAPGPVAVLLAALYYALAKTLGFVVARVVAFSTSRAVPVAAD